MKIIREFYKIFKKSKFKHKLLFLLFIFVFIILIILSYNIIFFSTLSIQAKILLVSITILLYSTITSSYTLNIKKILKLNETIENYSQYNKTLSLLYDNTKAFKHDFNNIIQAIGGYIESNDMQGLKIYYKQFLHDCKLTNGLSALSPQVVNHPAIYNLLAAKYHKANELDVEINLEIFLDLNTLNIKIYEFSRIFGILLDNAIEAAVQCQEKIINIIIRDDFLANRQLVIIENTYNDFDIDINKIFEKGYTSKKNNTGLGLWEIKRIMLKSKNLNLFTSKTSRLFIQQLEIYKQKEVISP